jgi:hypothetical protein
MLPRIGGPLLESTDERLNCKATEFLARVIDGGEGRSSELPDGNSIKPYHSELVRNGQPMHAQRVKGANRHLVVVHEGRRGALREVKQLLGGLAAAGHRILCGQDQRRIEGQACFLQRPAIAINAIPASARFVQPFRHVSNATVA